MKRHSWKKPDLKIFDKHMSCKFCNLQKASTKKERFRETFYFELDENGIMVYGGVKTNRVPYGCGDKKPESKFHLEDELFEI